MSFNPLTLALTLALALSAAGLVYLVVLLQRLSGNLTQARKEIEAVRAEVDEKESDRLDLEASRAIVQEERDDLASLLNGLPRPIWRRGPDLDLIYCNDAYLEAVGASRAEVIKRGIELVGQQQVETAKALAGQALEAGAARSKTLHVVASGQRKLFAITEQPMGDGTLAGYARDLTEVEDLQRSLERHITAQAAVLENLGVGISIWGPDLSLSFFNHAYANIWGLEEDFLSGRPNIGEVMEHLREQRRLPEQIDFAEYKKRRTRQFQTLIDPFEELLHTPDGRTMRMSAFPHPFGGVVLTYEDVTDTLTLEGKYNTLIEVQRETLDHLHEAVAVFGSDGRLKLYNPSFRRVWKLDEQPLESQPHVREVVEWMHPSFKDDEGTWERQAERMVAQATEAEERSGRLHRADGSIIDWAQVPLPDGASLFTYVDMTDSFRVEQALRERNEALETADRLKTEFLANVSYELRTPLNAIVGFSQMLASGYHGELSEGQSDYVDSIVLSAEQLTTLIDDILDLASIEAGYLELDRKPQNLHELAATAAGIVRERARDRGIELRLVCPEDIGIYEIDGRRMTQALFNLLANAVKYTPPGGRITLGGQATDEGFELYVSDTGVGISEEDQKHVFEEFKGRRGLSRQTGGGAGLGLSLVKRLIELHGGGVALDSFPGQGTTITCSIPATRLQSAVLPEGAAVNS